MFSLVTLRLLESYFRHRWLYLLPIALMIVVAALYPRTVDTKYIASGNIYIQRETLLSSLTALGNEGFSWVTPAQATSAEINELFKTDAFLNAVIQQTDLGIEMTQGPQVERQTIDEVRSSIWTHPQGNNLLTIAASHRDPRIANQLASAIINTYIEWKINLGLEGSMAAQNFFLGLVNDYQAELDPVRRELTDYLTAHPEPLRGERPASELAEIARLQATVDQGVERLRAAETKEENARLAMVQTESDVRQTYFTVDEPSLPDEPTRSRKGVLIAMAACVAAGVLLSGMAVLGGALLDSTYRFPIDVRHGLGLPVLTMVPETKMNPVLSAKPAAVDERKPTAGLQSPNGPATSQFRRPLSGNGTPLGAGAGRGVPHSQVGNGRGASTEAVPSPER